MLVSRKSRADIQVRPLPVSLAHPELELLEAALQSLLLATFPSVSGILGGKVFQVLADKPRQSSVPLDGDFPDLLHEIILESERDVHIHIIRESRKLCKCYGPLR